MTYDSVQDKFIIISKTIEPIRMGGANDSSNFLSASGLIHPDDLKVEKTYGEAGQNAIIEVDGRTYQRSTNTIEDVIAGVSFNVTGKGVATIEVDVSTDSAVDSLAAFVKSYNEMINKLNPAEITREERADKMDPLTEEQKTSMSDEEVKKYEEEYERLHTVDIMSKQSEIKQLKDALRRNIMDNIPTNSSSMFTSLADMGIRIAGEGDIEITRYGFLMTTSTNLDDIKKAITDNSTLMNNLRNNTEEVYKFFGEYDETTDKNGKITVNEDSWARRYERMLINMQDVEGPIGGKIRVNGALDRQMQSIQDQIDRKTVSIEKYLERLWSQFTAMETRIAQVNNQANYISQLSASAASSGK
jgi:flagellar hook-associated protein 2